MSYDVGVRLPLPAPFMQKWLSGRASPCQGEGREFKSRLLLQERYRSGHNGAVLKTVRVQAHVGSNPTLSAIYAQVAQSVEQGTENPCVGGSIPPLGTKFNCYFITVFFVFDLLIKLTIIKIYFI